MSGRVQDGSSSEVSRTSWRLHEYLGDAPTKATSVVRQQGEERSRGRSQGPGSWPEEASGEARCTHRESSRTAPRQRVWLLRSCRQATSVELRRRPSSQPGRPRRSMRSSRRRGPRSNCRERRQALTAIAFGTEESNDTGPRSNPRSLQALTTGPKVAAAVRSFLPEPWGDHKRWQWRLTIK